MRTRTKPVWLWATLIALLVPAAQAMTAPFCVVSDGVADCIYADRASCQRDAAQRSGTCEVNVQEAPPPYGSAPLCLISDGGTDCIYTDRASCQRDAAQRSGTCVPKPKR